MLPVASADEELDLGKECLKVRDVWHGKFYKPVEKGERDTREIMVRNVIKEARERGEGLERERN